MPNTDPSRSGIGIGIKYLAAGHDRLATPNANLPYSGLGLRLDHIAGGSARLRTPIHRFNDRQRYLSGSPIYRIGKRAVVIARVISFGIRDPSPGDDRA